MLKTSSRLPERFDELLSWLDEDPAKAATVYLEIRNSLVKIFGWNHCTDPEGLTDEVFDRVARKLPGLKDSFEGDPKLYFYGVANNLIKESRKAATLQVPLDGVDRPSDSPLSEEEDTRDLRRACLESCLQALSPEKRDLILSYYAREKREKIIHRAEMARRLGVSIRTLRVRMLRLREGLEDCIERCLDEKR
jgi:RNA polymerase sigma factor (sigma-70 family)